MKMNNQNFLNSQFSFLSEWGRLSFEEKNKKYSSHFSHEMNIFAYLKDREYFEKVVRPHIECKMEKQMIDYYLLEDLDKLREFSEIENIDKLNAFEKCLLVHAFREIDKELAESVLDLIKMKSKLGEFDSNKTFRLI